MKKKLLSLMMACAMILSLAVPAFAADYFTFSEAGNSLTPDGIDFAAKIFVPTVKLSMPALVSTSNPVVLNPYKLVYNGTDDKLNEVAVGANSDRVKQVISPVYAIENETNVPMKFAVKTTTVLNSDAFTLATSNVALTQSAKQAYLTLVVKKTAATAAEHQALGGNTSNAQELDPFDTAKNEVVVLVAGEKSTQPAQLKKLAAASSGSKNYLQFQFQGSMTRSPSTGWTTDDTFTTTLEFTFTPEGNQDYTALATLTTGGSGQKLGAALSGTAPSIAVDVVGTATSGKYHSVKAPTASADSADVTLANNKITDLAGATPSWSMVSGGAFGASIDNSGVIKYTNDIGKTLANGTNTDDLIIGFNDKNGVPKTIGVTVTITHTAS